MMGHNHAWLCRAPEKVFGLLDCHENLDAMLPVLHDILSGVCSCGSERPAWDSRRLSAWVSGQSVYNIGQSLLNH
jgi:hypothetical protein